MSKAYTRHDVCPLWRIVTVTPAGAAAAITSSQNARPARFPSATRTVHLPGSRRISTPPHCAPTSSRRSTGMKRTSRNNKASSFYEGTEIAIDRFVAHVIAMK